jgi:hypothetical protein
MSMTEITTMDEATMLAAFTSRFSDIEESSNSNALGRVRILRDNVEDSDGDILCPAGHFAVTYDGDTVYAKTVDFRYYDHRYRHKRYDADAERKNRDGSTSRGSYVHSVLVKGQRDEAPSEDGSFQCGRPLEYIKDWNSLSKDRQEFIRSCRIMTIFFGEAHVVGVNKDNEKVDVTVPVEMELSGKTSGKTLSRFYHDIAVRLSIHPNFCDVTLKSKKITGGVTYYDIEASVHGDPCHKMDDHAVDMLGRFSNHVSQINKWILEKHNGAISPNSIDKSVTDDSTFVTLDS